MTTADIAAMACCCCNPRSFVHHVVVVGIAILAFFTFLLESLGVTWHDMMLLSI